ncbi:hypothetical protein HOG16_03310 [Candidatus Woesearchaeota archaeon]|jgi:hypothetical protein|nr:hypothetical protein [Candidatus Woesearchaeota archaeon]MBT4322350.1 hypothetical protein [Candidatus Woesearchaeota archaeon]MBT4630950.1 hypothetical protein [Candidatus Woesearchaeota archaeon]
MKIITDAKILCDKCNIKTNPKYEIRKGFQIKFHECPKCMERFYNPLDLKQYQEFQKLKQREFEVKLRMVGNSFSVTIPKEIIEFEGKSRQMEKEMDQMMRLCLEEPNKLSLRFRKIMEK